MARERIVKIPLGSALAYDWVVTKFRNRLLPATRQSRRLYSVFERAWNRRRTVDIDSATTWPDSITVIENDDFGPLVIAIADATVFPDGSVKSRGRWITSKTFGLSAPRRRSTVRILFGAECAVVSRRTTGKGDVLESVGARLATLGRTRAGIPVLVPATRRPLTEIIERCSLTPAGVLVGGGSARTVPAALFARLPVADDRDGQQRGFAAIFRSHTSDSANRVYLESDVDPDSHVEGQSVIDVRFDYEQSGLTLIAARTSWADDFFARTASLVAEAAEIVIESEDMRPFASFALPTTPVTVASPARKGHRSPDRVTATSRFDMDAALRDGSTLPRGVEVLSQPDYDVPDTTVANHRVFVNGKWRAQSDDVLIERSVGPWILSVRNAIVAPNGSVMLEDGTQLGGLFFGEYLRPSPIDGWVTAETSRPSGLGLTTHDAFGHALLQVAPRLDALMQHDRTMDVLVTDFPWDDSPLLKRVGVERGRVRRVSSASAHHLLRVPELIVSTQLHPELQTARADPKWQAEFVSRFLGTSAVTPSRRVHFARRGAAGERGGCVNRRVLSDLATEFGYEEVHPELLSFDEQVELVASTVDMFGERGSAMNWSLFLPSDSRTVLVNGKDLDRKVGHLNFHNPVLAARGSHYREINAVRAGSHNYFEVDPRGVRRALQGMS